MKAVCEPLALWFLAGLAQWGEAVGGQEEFEVRVFSPSPSLLGAMGWPLLWTEGHSSSQAASPYNPSPQSTQHCSLLWPLHLTKRCLTVPCWDPYTTRLHFIKIALINSPVGGVHLFPAWTLPDTHSKNEFKSRNQGSKSQPDSTNHILLSSTRASLSFGQD